MNNTEKTILNVQKCLQKHSINTANILSSFRQMMINLTNECKSIDADLTEINRMANSLRDTEKQLNQVKEDNMAVISNIENFLGISKKADDLEDDLK